MGCDIHAYVEIDRRFRDGEANFWCVAPDVYIGREYLLFGIMAGVRRDDLAPVVEPRGVPDNTTWETMNAYTLYITNDENLYDSSGYCSAEQAARWIGYGSSRRIDERRITHPDWHTASWLNLTELIQVQDRYQKLQGKPNQAIGGIIAMMQAWTNDLPERARLVFWFDN